MCNSEGNGAMTDKCSICGRRLKNLQSKELGYGPICYRKKIGIALHSGIKNVGSSASGTYRNDLSGQMFIGDFLQEFQ